MKHKELKVLLSSEKAAKKVVAIITHLGFKKDSSVAKHMKNIETVKKVIFKNF